MVRLSGVRRLLLAAMLVALGATAAQAASVQVFSPTGTVKDVRQVAVRFSANMVALGDPRLPDPFAVSCPAKGKGRWADQRNWVYDFDEDLPGGVVCKFTVKPELKGLDGAGVSGVREFSFDTGGPSIRAAQPYEGFQQIDEDQVFVLALDAPADPASVETNAYCAVDGIGERIPLKVLRGAERAAMLKEQRRIGYAYYSLLWKDAEWTDLRIRDRTMTEKAEAQITLARCQRRLPPATKVELVWGKGIATPAGMTTPAEQRLAFQVRPTFTARAECERVNAQAGCLPMRPIRVSFSSPVPRDKALAVTMAGPGGKVFKPDAATREATLQTVEFKGPFPERAVLKVTMPAGMADDAGRRLENGERFPLDMRVDSFPPLAKFNGEFGIIEAHEGGVLPVTVRNIEPLVAGKASVTPAMAGNAARMSENDAQIAEWLRRVKTGMESRGDYVGEGAQGKWEEKTGDTSVFAGVGGEGVKAMAFRLPKPEGAKAFEVVGIPLKNPGFYVVELASPILGEALMAKGKVRHVATAALVTDMAVHFKQGREGSAVWVTRLHDSQPVKGAEIAVSDFCTGQVLWTGETGKGGIATIEAGKLPEPGYGSERCGDYGSNPLMVSARTDSDMSFTLTTWNNGIAPYDFNLSSYGAQDSMVHTVFDRPLFRAGETVSMKHFLRRHTSAGVASINPGKDPVKVAIVHTGSDTRYENALKFDANGIAVQTWQIPPEAKLGDYAVQLMLGDQTFSAGSFKVEEFRVPTMSGLVQGPDKPQVRVKQVPLDLYVSYLSGGGAGGAQVKLRTVTTPWPVSFPDYDGFTFGGKPVKEGLQTEEGSPYDFDPEAQAAGAKPVTQVMPLTLDAKGALRVTAAAPSDIAEPSRMVAELEYADANGEIQTATGRIGLYPSAVNLGIKTDGWAGSSDKLRFTVVALDLKGKPASGQNVRVSLYQRTTYSYRKRLIGGFYDYESSTKVSLLPTSCDGDTDGKGYLHCDVAPGVSGELLIRAQTKDDGGNAAGATMSAYVAGADDSWFGQGASDRMDVIPEKPEYEAGETARFQVRSPFRSATALVTVEREGVIESFVTEISGSDPVIKVPIRDNYAPNVYVSVLAVRGRVGDWKTWLSDMGREYDLPRWMVSRDGGKPTALVDLSKPAYRMGMGKIRVGWAPHRLDVEVKPSGDTFKVRDQVKVKIHVERANGKDMPAGGEVAIAAVDEGLLALAPNNSWKLLDAMMGERAMEVWSSTAQMQVVGKRHYGRKAVPAGGGGGQENARELFDTLLIWKGRARLDADGNAEVTIPLNDSLTSFRIVAVANAGQSLFGTGEASIKTTQELMVHSGLPLMVREGDRFNAMFTVRNTTGSSMDVEAEAVVTPAVGDTLKKQVVKVPAGGAYDLTWPVTVPNGPKELTWNVTIRGKDSATGDHLRVKQAVKEAVPVRTFQATLEQVDSNLVIPAERPADAIPGRGGLAITLRSTLGSGLDGVRDYMADYRYNCFEQSVSKAVALRDTARWRTMMDRMPAYQDSDGLLKYFESDRLQGDDTLTAYVLAIAHEAGWEIPDAERVSLIEALTKFIEGRIIRGSALPTADLAIRKIAAIEALSRYGSARPEMLTSIAIESALWPTSAVIDWRNILQRMTEIPGRDQKLAQADSILRSRLNFQGTTMGFSTERTDALWWLMISPDSNAVRAVLGVMESPRWQPDIPRMVRGALGRQQHGHWNTTVANAWGVLAMEKFSARYEATPVTGETRSSYGGQTASSTWEGEKKENLQNFPWVDGRQDLTVTQQGTGKPWAMVRAQAAIPLREPFSSGFKVVRTVTAVEQARKGVWTRGDVARVRLDLEAQSDMTWVVVDDPIPAGATILGSGLGGQSDSLVQDEQQEGYAWKAYEERRSDGFIAYYRFVPKGKWTVEYTVRFNNPGLFQLPATHVEAMYAPEMLGEYPNRAVEVKAP
jgi:uncharacterized protein YfaS (alpha-2-macroglobulin family)